MKSPLVILPCAGFGRRVGNPPAKELLPLRAGQPLINEPLEKASRLQWPCLVITRAEKVTLLDHCKKYFPETQINLISQSEEWPHSILAAQACWAEWNLLVLPDTAYAPEDIWTQMCIAAAGDVQLVVAQHEVTSTDGWGQVQIQDDQVLLAEKVPGGAGLAWGLLLFHRDIGEGLFTGFIRSRAKGQALPFPGVSATAIKLQSFQDLTR